MGNVGGDVDVERESDVGSHLDGGPGRARRGKVPTERTGPVGGVDRPVERERHHVGSVAGRVGHERGRVGASHSDERRGERQVGVADDDVIEAARRDRANPVVDGTVQAELGGPQRRRPVGDGPVANLGVVTHDERGYLTRRREHAVGEEPGEPLTLIGRQDHGQALFGLGERLDGDQQRDVHPAECRNRDPRGGYGRRMGNKGIEVGVIGAGSWGTTVAAMTSANTSTTLWSRREALTEEINESHTNGDYLPSFQLPDALSATSDLERLVSRADVIVMAVPSHGYRDVARQVAEHLRPWVPVVTLSKGLERETRRRMSQVTEEEMPGHPVAVLTGPNLAKEIISGQPAASVIAIDDLRIAEELQRVFSRPSLRVYTNPDVVGCEVAGVVKNVIAIASGMAQGMGFGDNTRATLITRGLAEMTRLGEELGGDTATFAGLAGMGDLIATCASTQSRNNTVGRRLGQGETIEEIVSSMNMVAEGVKSCPSVLDLAREYGVEMPITEQVVAVCHDGRTAEDALAALMGRDAKQEHD